MGAAYGADYGGRQLPHTRRLCYKDGGPALNCEVLFYVCYVMEVLSVENEGKYKRKRPGWVWVMSILFIVSGVWSLVININMGAVSVNTAPKADFTNMHIIGHNLVILIALTNIVGAVLLFYLRKVAIYFFITSLLALFYQIALLMATIQLVGEIGIRILLSASIVLCPLIAVCVYTRKLTKRGILR